MMEHQKAIDADNGSTATLQTTQHKLEPTRRALIEDVALCQ